LYSHPFNARLAVANARLNRLPVEVQDQAFKQYALRPGVAGCPLELRPAPRVAPVTWAILPLRSLLLMLEV